MMDIGAIAAALDGIDLRTGTPPESPQRDSTRSNRTDSPASKVGQRHKLSPRKSIGQRQTDPELGYEPCLVPASNATRVEPDELYLTTPYDAPTLDERSAETRPEYTGSSGSSSEAEQLRGDGSGPSSSSSSLLSHQQQQSQSSAPLQYPVNPPPLFYNSTSHTSMPLSPPSLFNLVPGGSPTFTYHHSFTPNFAPTTTQQPQLQSFPTLQPQIASSHFGAVPDTLSNGFGLGVGAHEVPVYGPGMAMGTGNGPVRRNPSPSYLRNAQDDEVIETAIVIKSIPFACPREQLLALMASLQLPIPLAFNYHYDLSLNPTPQQQEPRQDQFRGLAFANFRNGEEARIVVCALNGFEFMGRKLRTEFKKVLKPGEKEAIERNKALKRIRSVQMLSGAGSSNGSNHQHGTNHQNWDRGNAGGGNRGTHQGWNEPKPRDAWNRRDGHANSNGYHRSFEPDETTTEEYGRLVHSHAFASSAAQHTNLFGPSKDITTPFSSGMTHGSPSENLMDGSTVMSGSGSGSGSLLSSGGRTGVGRHSDSGSDSEEGVGSSVSVREELKKGLDLNDPQTLQLYSQLLLFSSSPSPPNPSSTEFEGMSSIERRKVKMIARMLGLGYGSEDIIGGGKRVLLWKTGSQAAPLQPSLRSISSAGPLRRPASTSSFHALPSTASSFVPPPVPSLPAFSSYLSPPGSTGLRGKKSMPEFRPSSGSSSFYATDAPPLPSNSFGRPQLSNLGRKSSSNLRAPQQQQQLYRSESISSFPSFTTQRTRDVSSSRGLFRHRPAASATESSLSSPIEARGGLSRKEFYSTGLDPAGSSDVGSNGLASLDFSAPRIASDTNPEWRTRRT
ncbi:Pin4p [Sporobolomyces koalae]|uniref:Pin4p n=1 Tax=Sporobolomyces koalae TaxID=500713 RepID=UPI00316B7389